MNCYFIIVLLKRILCQKEVKELFLKITLLLTTPDFERGVKRAREKFKNTYYWVAPESTLEHTRLPMLGAVTGQRGVMRTTCTWAA